MSGFLKSQASERTNVIHVLHVLTPGAKPSGNRQRKPWSPLENGGLLGLIRCWLPSSKVRLTTFPLPSHIFSHFASEVYQFTLTRIFPELCASLARWILSSATAKQWTPFRSVFHLSIRFDPLRSGSTSDQPFVILIFWIYYNLLIIIDHYWSMACFLNSGFAIKFRQGWTESKMSRERFSRLGSVYHIPVQGMCSHNLFCRSCASCAKQHMAERF